MKKHIKQFTSLQALVLAASLGAAMPASAALVVQSNGTVYDTDRNIYWLQNANLAATTTFGVSGIQNFSTFAGMMYFATAQSWIAAMNANNYLGFNDWRLPTALQPDASCSPQAPSGPVVSYGYSCSGSELGHLFYTEFAALAGKDPSSGNAAQVAKFNNVQNFSYWSGTEDASTPGSYLSFNFKIGAQSPAGGTDYDMFVWPVRNGSTFTPGPMVPEPGTLLMLVAGLLGVLAAARQRSQRR